VGCGSAGELWPNDNGRTLSLWFRYTGDTTAYAGGTCTPWTHMQEQLVDLQQSGLECLEG
jgi:hypothetical protein